MEQGEINRSLILGMIGQGLTFTVSKYSYRDDMKRNMLKKMSKKGIVKRVDWPKHRKQFAYVKGENYESYMKNIAGD